MDDAGNSWRAVSVKAFGERLKLTRQELGVSQADLAERLAGHGLDGAHQMFVSRIESGQREATLFEALVIATALGVDLAVLTSDDRQTVSLEQAGAVSDKARNALRDEAGDYTRALVQLAATADLVDADPPGLSDRWREWLVSELRRQTPSQMTTDSLTAAEAWIELRSIEGGKWLAFLLDHLREDKEALRALRRG